MAYLRSQRKAFVFKTKSGINRSLDSDIPKDYFSVYLAIK
jgi:hypothetical protein